MLYKKIFLCLVLSILIVLTTIISANEDAAAKASQYTENKMVFDSMDSLEGWEVFHHEKCSGEINLVDGVDDKALEFKYNLPEQYAGFKKNGMTDFSEYSVITFNTRGTGGKNSVEFKLIDEDGSTFGTILRNKSNTTKWTEVQIPFSDLKYWWGGDENLDLTKVRIEFAISVKDNDSGGEGTILVDNIILKKGKDKPKKLKKTENTISSMDFIDEWNVATDKDVVCNLKTVKGKKGNAIEINYEFNGGGWCAVPSKEKYDFSQKKGFKFVYKGTGKKNSFEAKLQDEDGSVFGKILDTKSNVDEWTEVTLKFNDLKYWWGGDEKLSRNNLIIEFAVSIKDGDKGGKGTVMIDNLEFLK